MYSLTQLLIIDRFWKYIPPISDDKDWTKDIPHLEDVFRVAEEKWWEYELLANSEWHELFIYWTLVKLFHTKYNPKLKPYQQTEETMQEILKLFK